MVSIKLEFSQLLEAICELSETEKQKLILFLNRPLDKNDKITQTHFASENVLSKDWLDEKEDKAWENL